MAVPLLLLVVVSLVVEVVVAKKEEQFPQPPSSFLPRGPRHATPKARQVRQKRQSSSGGGGEHRSVVYYLGSLLAEGGALCVGGFADDVDGRGAMRGGGMMG